MPQPSPAQGHYDQLLTNMSVAYIQSQDAYIADKVFPQFPVDHLSGLYMRFPKGYFFRDDVQRRGPGDEPAVVGYDIDKLQYVCYEDALQTHLDQQERFNATPPYDPERSKILFLTQQMMIHRDRRWATSYFQTGQWGQDINGVAATPAANQILQWDNANSKPADDVEALRLAMKQNTGFEPNVLVLGRNTFRRLKSNQNILTRMQYTNPDAITTDMLARLFELDAVVIAGGVYNTAPELAPGAMGMNAPVGTPSADNVSMQFIAAQNSALLAYRAPSVGLMTPTAGYTFTCMGLVPGQSTQAPVFRDIGPFALYDKFAVRMAYGFQIVAPDLGIFINNCVGV